MTRTNPAIQPRGLKDILSQFDQAGFDLFKCSLIEREAFRAIISFGGLVNDLDKKQVSGTEKAAANALAYAAEAKPFQRFLDRKPQALPLPPETIL
jgi:chromosome partitioning protein